MRTIWLGHSAGKCDIFTLVELLVVVAIIAILAGLLLPALGKARGMALMTGCANNLKNIGQGAVMYQDDWDGYFPGRMASSGPFFSNLSPYVKTRNDNPQTAGDAGVFCCPADNYRLKLGTCFQFSYGQNYYLCWENNDTSNPLCRATNVRNPSNKIYLLDCIRDAAGNEGWTVMLSVNTFPFNLSANTASRPDYRHNNMANTLWADIHVSPVRHTDLAGKITLLKPWY